MADEIDFENGRISNFQRHTTLTWMGPHCILSCITHRPLPTHQISLDSEKLCEWTDVRTYGQTLLGWLGGFDLKKQSNITTTASKDLQRTEWQYIHYTYATINGISSCQNAAAGVQFGMNSCLRDGHATLFHHFVDGSTVNVRHLVKLVDADDATVSEHHSSGFQSTFTYIIQPQSSTSTVTSNHYDHIPAIVKLRDIFRLIATLLSRLHVAIKRTYSTKVFGGGTDCPAPIWNWFYQKFMQCKMHHLNYNATKHRVAPNVEATINSCPRHDFLKCYFLTFGQFSDISLTTVKPQYFQFFQTNGNLVPIPPASTIHHHHYHHIYRQTTTHSKTW